LQANKSFILNQHPVNERKDMKKLYSLMLVLLAFVSLSSTALANGGTIALQFVNHLQAGLPEQDVFVEKVVGSSEVFRLLDTEKDLYMNAPLYATATTTPHDPFTGLTNPAANGPFQKGNALNVTLGEWLAATGTGSYQCVDGQGEIALEFSGLVPNGVYTLWYVFSPTPPATPFMSLDLPFGARDGSQTVVSVNADGTATYKATVTPCLQMSGEQAATLIALAYHSDSKSHGSLPGDFGLNSHIQLMGMFPAAE
jgi:hypothetical protein